MNYQTGSKIAQYGRFKVKMYYRVGSLLMVVLLFGAWSNAQGTVGNEVGNEGPDFTLPNTDNESVTLSARRGIENVILIFYRGQW